MITNEGDIQFEHSLNHCLEFFSKAASVFDNTRTFYKNPEDSLDLFQKAWITDKETTLKILFWLRDCRGGAGNRSAFRRCIKWLASRKEDYKWVKENVMFIPEYGRYDDLRSLFNSYCHNDAVKLWLDAIFNNNILAAKWAKRTDIPLYIEAKKQSKEINNIGDFRRLLSKIRSNNIIESKMCSKQWSKIEYSKVPSVAMSRYLTCFYRNDEIRFNRFKEDLVNKKTKVNTGVLFPHDCVRAAKSEADKGIVDEMFNSLPNYIGNNNSIMVLCDSSGSMEAIISGTIKAFDVAVGLALYCSNFVPKDSPFYKKFIQFGSESSFSFWDNLTFTEALRLFDGYCGSTRIDKALDLILDSASLFNVKNDDMPKMLLICSDMQFTAATKPMLSITQRNRLSMSSKPSAVEYSIDSAIETSLKRWDDCGYNRPKIVYWNLFPYPGQPVTSDMENVAMVSGFSPSILKSIFNCDILTPYNIMMEAIKKYNVNVPVD